MILHARDMPVMISRFNQRLRFQESWKARILLIGATAAIILICPPFARAENAPAEQTCPSSSKKQCAKEGGTTTTRGTTRATRRQPIIEEAPRPGIPIGETELRRLKSLPGPPR